MNQPLFLKRVVLRNYRSIGVCDVRLGALTYLVGANGSGKSNFLDALHLVRDALSTSLDNALNERGGLSQVRRRSYGHPTHFAVRLEFLLPDGREGFYAFDVGALPDRGYQVGTEKCFVSGKGKGPFFHIERGELKESSETSFPAVTADRLALVSVSGMAVFRPVYDAFMAMGFYNLNPKLMRDPQKPQDGRLLKPVGENVASVIGHLERVAPEGLSLIEEYLQTVVPGLESVRRQPIGPLETLEFRQRVAGAKDAWRFPAQNMSDGTLRALGILTALFQGNRDFAPLLIGIEEPETALHPSASAALREALMRASKRTQIVVTSHSPDLLDDRLIPPEQFLAVAAEGGETKIATLDGSSKEMMRAHLFSAGELLRLNQLSPDESDVQAQAKQVGLFDEALS